MENAGRGATDSLLVEFGNSRRVVVCCGSGNNGGDGFVVARRLMTRGVDVLVFSTAALERLSPDSRVMRQAYEGLGGRVESLTPETLRAVLTPGVVVVDALLGTGLDREVKGATRSIIEAINAVPCSVVSLDIPSGLDADSGAVLGVAVESDLTVTFAHLKLGLLTPRGRTHAGKLVVTDIGVPADLVEHVGHSALAVEPGDLSKLLGKRSAASHKGDSGRVSIVAGSPGTLGAARLVAHGALRAGAGLVTLVNFDDCATRLEGQVSEAMTARLDRTAPAKSLQELAASANSVVVGPGLGTDETARELVLAALSLPCPKVFDADALSVLSKEPGALAHCATPCILTPHPGEAARLLGKSAAEVEADRFKSLEQLVELTQCVVVLKGAHTLVGGPNHTTRINMSGGPALATGGAGDVLAGIIGAYCVALPPLEAATLGVGVHGLCGESWQARIGADRGLLASEIADEVPRVLAQLSSGGRTMTV